MTTLTTDQAAHTALMTLYTAAAAARHWHAGAAALCAEYTTLGHLDLAEIMAKQALEYAATNREAGATAHDLLVWEGRS
jgi:hypothetical protein